MGKKKNLNSNKPRNSNFLWTRIGKHGLEKNPALPKVGLWSHWKSLAYFHPKAISWLAQDSTDSSGTALWSLFLHNLSRPLVSTYCTSISRAQEDGGAYLKEAEEQQAPSPFPLQVRSPSAGSRETTMLATLGEAGHLPKSSPTVIWHPEHVHRAFTASQLLPAPSSSVSQSKTLRPNMDFKDTYGHWCQASSIYLKEERLQKASKGCQPVWLESVLSWQLSGVTEPEAFLYSKDHGSQSTEAEQNSLWSLYKPMTKIHLSPWKTWLISLGCSSATVQRPGLESQSFELTKWLRLTYSGEGSSDGKKSKPHQQEMARFGGWDP